MRSFIRSLTSDYRYLSTSSTGTGGTSSSSSSSSSSINSAIPSGNGCGPRCSYAKGGAEYGSSGDGSAISVTLPRYYLLKSERLSPPYRLLFQPLSCDTETQDWMAQNRPNWCLDVLARFLRKFMSLTDANAFLGRGQMFVLSTRHASELLKIPYDLRQSSSPLGTSSYTTSSPSSSSASSLLASSSFSNGSNVYRTLLDVGAGDGGVTARLEPLFSSITVTEVSVGMLRRLRSRGYNVIHTSHLAPHVIPLPRSDSSSSSASSATPSRTDGYDVVSIFNVLDRCDQPFDLLRDAVRLTKKDGGRLIIAIVLPFAEFVEEGRGRRPPKGPLPMENARCHDGASFEASLDALLNRVIRPLGVVVERIARVPYICRGEASHPFYVLSDAIIILRHKTLEEEQESISSGVMDNPSFASISNGSGLAPSSFGTTTTNNSTVVVPSGTSLTMDDILLTSSSLNFPSATQIMEGRNTKKQA